MFLKRFKKSISLSLVLVFALSLLPFGAMAAQVTTDPALAMINVVNTRGDRATTGNVNAFTNTLRLQSGTGNADWHVYAQFDLSNYREILENDGTNVTFGIKVGGNTSGTQVQRDFKIYLMNDSCDYFTSDITYNEAKALGLHNPEENGQIIAQVDDDEIYNRFDLYSVNIPKNTILDALNQGKDNSLITLVFTTTETSNATCFIRDSGILTITYDDALINNKDYADSIADGLTWADISDEPQTAITKDLNLPTQLYGASVEWSSDDEDVVTSEGVINPGFETKETTINAILTYKGGESKIKSFDVALAKKTYNYPAIYAGDTSFITISSANRQYITVTSGVNGLGGKTADDVIYSIHDLAGDDKYINYHTGDAVLDPAKNNDVMEFSAYLPIGTEQMRFTAEILDNSGESKGQITHEYYLRADGLYYNNVKKVYDTKPNEWYNIAFAAPKGMITIGTPNEEDDTTCELYVNGELVHEAVCNGPTSYGFRTFRFWGMDAALTDPGYYLDNIRLHNEGYVPSYDKAPSLESSLYSVRENVIAMPNNTSLGQLKASLIKDRDTSVRAYESKTDMTSELSDGDILLSGNVIVAASANGTNLEKGYSYYLIDNTDYIIKSDIFVNGVPSNEFESLDTVSAETEFKNYGSDTQNVTMYVAQYKDNELVGLWRDEKTVLSGETKILSPVMTDFAGVAGSSIKLMLVSSDTLTPYIKPLGANYKAGTDVTEPEEPIKETVYLNRTFDEEDVPPFDKLTITPGENTIEIGQNTLNRNKYIVLNKTKASESHIGFAGTETGNYHIIEASFSTENTTPSGRLIYVRDGEAASMFNTFLNVKADGSVETADGDAVATIEANKWTDIALVINVGTLKFDIYVDKELKLAEVPFKNNTITALPLIRMSCDNSSSTGTLLIDNIKSYESDRLNYPITEQDNVPINYLGTKKAVQPYSNTIYADGVKEDSTYDIIAENEDTVIYAHIDDIEALFGTGVTPVSAHAQKAGYYNLLETAEANGYLCQNMDTRLFVFDTLTPSLDETQLKSIQRYMYYERPTADELMTLYNQTSSGHPRILMDNTRLSEIKSLYSSDTLMKEWGDNVIKTASVWLGRDFGNYQEILDNADGAITNLAMAYHLTGDSRYAARAWHFIKTICALENWSPDHYLTTSEFTYIVALGYDWLYDTLSEEQKKYIEENLLKKGVGYTHKLYFNQLEEGIDGYLGWWQSESNWNAVCNGGAICGAIALMDVYPDICSELIENAQKGLEAMLTLYYPHGTYEEGISYWNYAYTYLTHAFISMRNAFGTDFGFFDVPGLSETGWYVINLTGSTTVMTMGDVNLSELNNPHIMFAADEYNDKLLMSARLNEMEKLEYEGGVFEMLYYNPNLLGEEASLPLDTYMEGAEAISLRERWYDKNAVYLGASGGNNKRQHGHMDIGSYVVDMAGERFITDIGAESYEADGGYFTTNRYYFYRARPEGHNLYIINPENSLDYYGMDRNASATGELKVSKPKGAIATMDLSRAYAGYATKAQRGYMLTDNRQSVVVRDEIDLANESSEVRWHIQTEADEIEFVGDNQAILTQNGKKLLMTVDTNAAQWSFGEGTPQTLAEITKTVVTEKDNVKAGIRKLELVIADASGRLNISVKYRLLEDDSIDSNPPAGDISSWIIPDA